MPLLPKRLRDFRYRAFNRLFMDRGFELCALGDLANGCQWTFCPSGLNARSIVYSGGIGGDITFEHALVKRFGCQIVLYDPTPAGVETMALPENKLPQFSYFQLALAGHSGTLKLAPPPGGGDSWFAQDNGSALLEVPCTDLQSLMRQCGHDHIDLLKLDIEGSEYEVIDDFLERRIPVSQVCVEFHHANVPGITRRQTLRAMLKLRLHGFRFIGVTGINHVFARKPASIA